MSEAIIDPKHWRPRSAMVLAAGLGCLLGYATHCALHLWLAGLLAAPLPPPALQDLPIREEDTEQQRARRRR